MNEKVFKESKNFKKTEVKVIEISFKKELTS